MLKSLRVWEMERENRRPFFLYEEPFIDKAGYFEGLCKRLGDDYELLRKQAAQDGVELSPFTPQDPQRVAGMPPLERAVVHVERAGALLGERLDGVLLGLLPRQVRDAAAWRQSVAALARAPWSTRVLLSFFDPPGGPLESVLGAEGARFSVNRDELFDYLRQLATNKSAGPAGPPPPVPTEAQREEYERRTGQKLMSPDEGRALRTVLMDAAQHMSRGRHAEAAEAYRSARHICQAHGMLLEEATILVALAGLALAVRAPDQALECYRRAVAIGREKESFQLVAQAWLGTGAVFMMQKEYVRAAQAYEAAGDAARTAGVPTLRIEALRLAGTCHVLRGARDDAVPVWQKAVAEGAALDPQIRRMTTFREVAGELAAWLERNGLLPQAEHVRSLIEETAKGG
ncbi:hypothetical protein [Sorangium sp. So ce1153]|uniref:hypothetical protein n=1 Tax=Sorangium sp. So ce1153 TaxID=3133333 RepID=UPI003F5DAE21